MADMKDWKDWLWLIKTDKGDFFLTAMGDWTQDEAAEKVRLVFDQIKLSIIGMIPRKRATGDPEAMATLYQDEKEEKGFSFFSGKKLWVVCGRLAEYDAELIRSKAEG